jgi:hypothetical protein
MLLLSEECNTTQPVECTPVGMVFTGWCIVSSMIFMNYKIVIYNIFEP